MLDKLGLAVMMALTVAPLAASAAEPGDLLATHLYAGTLAEGAEAVKGLCADDNREACFASGVFGVALALEGLAQDFYRYGAVAPESPVPELFVDIDIGPAPVPPNPDPEPITYEALRTVLETFVTRLDTARAELEQGGASGDYVVPIDPFQIRIDFNGDGKTGPLETLGALAGPLGGFAIIGTPPVGKTKPNAPTADTSVGFDRADALWLAGYTQGLAAPVDLILAHDFSDFFAAYMHRIFPKSGLPMQDYSRGSAQLTDAEGDARIADAVAAIHTMNFPVIDQPRLANVLGRLKAMTALSRQNWEAILAETDDSSELVPSPTQTSILPDMTVTEETVAAWMASLDTLDQILAGELLVPHWRFKQQGIDLKTYFETAERTDLVMLLTGQGALPFLKTGPIADATSFAEANRVFGSDWLNYAIWFN